MTSRSQSGNPPTGSDQEKRRVSAGCDWRLDPRLRQITHEEHDWPAPVGRGSRGTPVPLMRFGQHVTATDAENFGTHERERMAA
jgi:hypothetical protein